MSGGLGKAAGVCVLAAALLFSVVRAPQWLVFPAPGSGYDFHEEWKPYLAPKDRRPGGDDAEAPPAQQEATMFCLINWA